MKRLTQGTVGKGCSSTTLASSSYQPSPSGPATVCVRSLLHVGCQWGRSSETQSLGKRANGIWGWVHLHSHLWKSEKLACPFPGMALPESGSLGCRVIG